jgi:hypothetical protein
LTRTIGILLACSLGSTVATAASRAAADVPMVLAPDQRIVAGGRAVEVILPQTQIETTIDVGRVASSANGGGLLGAIIISSMDDKRQVLSQSAHEKAEAAIEPLRQALKDFDLQALALATTKAALVKPDWFQPASFATTNDPAIQSRAEYLASVNTPEFALVSYRYETSPDFTQLRVIAEIQLERKAATTRNTPTQMPFFRQRVLSIVQLRNPSYEPSENVTRWSASDGKLAKAALTSAFARLEQLIPFALDLGETELKVITAKDHQKGFAAGYYGPLIEQSSGSTSDKLIWVNGLVNVQLSADGGAAGN